MSSFLTSNGETFVVGWNSQSEKPELLSDQNRLISCAQKRLLILKASKAFVLEKDQAPQQIKFEEEVEPISILCGREQFFAITQPKKKVEESILSDILI